MDEEWCEVVRRRSEHLSHPNSLIKLSFAISCHILPNFVHLALIHNRSHLTARLFLHIKDWQVLWEVPWNDMSAALGLKSTYIKLGWRCGGYVGCTVSQLLPETLGERKQQSHRQDLRAESLSLLWLLLLLQEELLKQSSPWRARKEKGLEKVGGLNWSLEIRKSW